MAPPTLTIRNLTSTPLVLKLVERYEAPRPQPRKAPVNDLTNVSKLGRNLGNLFTNVTTTVASTVVAATGAPSPPPSAPKLAENAQSFSKREVDIRIDAFKAQSTDVPRQEKSDNEIMRLTFESDGQRYRIDVPAAKKASQSLVPLVPDPKHRYTGIYLPRLAHLALFSSANLNSWMQELKDETPLSGLSIPGTHNSPTCHRALPSVRCQAVSPRAQLEHGVRFLDIRVQPESPENANKDGLILVHGVFPISLTGNRYLRDLLKDVRAFLDAHPTETVILSLKREGPGNATDAQLSRILHRHYAHDDDDDDDGRTWYTAPRIPTLGEVRGKIVLLRRFALDESLRGCHDGKGWGIDAECWAYNTPHDLHGDVCVQDFCEVLETENIERKIGFVEAHLGRSAQRVCPLPGVTTDATHPVPPDPFYLNFLSASNFWKVGCWPERIAAKLNPAVTAYLCTRHHQNTEEGDGGTGVLVLDWVGKHGDWDIVRCIVGMNSKLEMREKALLK